MSVLVELNQATRNLIAVVIRSLDIKTRKSSTLSKTGSVRITGLFIPKVALLMG